jgi:multisubunit Na+/H+ antiporter MnhG subunit
MLRHHLTDLPPVKPSAIALGTVFNHAASLAVLGPVFGDTYHRAQAANSKEEFVRSKEAASAAAAWGTSLVGSAVQSYGVGALINATGTLSCTGAAYLGSLIFMASSAPSVRLSGCGIENHLTYPAASVLEEFNTNYACSSSPKSSLRSVLLIPLLLVLSPVFSRLLVSRFSSHGGEPAPTHSTKGLHEFGS